MAHPAHPQNAVYRCARPLDRVMTHEQGDNTQMADVHGRFRNLDLPGEKEVTFIRNQGACTFQRFQREGMSVSDSCNTTPNQRVPSSQGSPLILGLESLVLDDAANMDGNYFRHYPAAPGQLASNAMQRLPNIAAGKNSINQTLEGRLAPKHKRLDFFIMFKLAGDSPLPADYEWAVLDSPGHHSLMPPAVATQTDGLYATASNPNPFRFVVVPAISSLPWQFSGMIIKASGLRDLDCYKDDDCSTLARLCDCFAASMPTVEQHLDALALVDWAEENASDSALPKLAKLSRQQRLKAVELLTEVMDICDADECDLVNNLLHTVETLA
eukprot:m.148692 g.148692  ORF g.148692 m.148692 type:complete len:327 (-) comp30613_c0_seq2:684-1664(-)